MPLGSWYAHHWYPGHAAMVDTSVPAQDLSASSIVTMGLIVESISSENLALVMAKIMTITNNTTVSQDLVMKAIVKMSMTNKIGELSADDVTGAVLQAEIAPGLTFKQALLDARKAAKLAAALSA